jgi:pimeloyl-ACP methyl ester carboxylesterase
MFIHHYTIVTFDYGSICVCHLSSLTQKKQMYRNPVLHFVFAPPQCSYSTKKPTELTYIQTKHTGKYTCAYYLPCSQETTTTILYSHGNASDIGQSYDFLSDLKEELKVNVLHYEYYGYGKLSHFRSSEEGCYSCGDAAYRWLKKNTNTENIILMGTSLGCAPTVHLATKYRGDSKLKGVFLESPFTSVVRVVTSFFLGKLLDCFDNRLKIAAVQAPVFIIHGMQDRVVPFEHGKELHNCVNPNYRYEPLWVETADHNDLKKRDW